MNNNTSNTMPELIFISKKAGKAIVDYKMLEEGDKVAVAVSGGKDSLSLLQVLRHRQTIAPINFEIIAVHISFDFIDFPTQDLIQYFEKEGFKYHTDRVELLKSTAKDEIGCFWCSWNRRKVLFEICGKLGCNKIAFGHHLDDIVETILLNQFYKGEVAAMKPKQELFGGKITIIRPFTYVRERNLERLAQKLGITHFDKKKCANDSTSQRRFIKDMIKMLEKDNKNVVKNIFNSLKNIKEEYLP